MPHAAIATEPLPPGWHVLWTQSHCEDLVDDRLSGRGFETFLPKINVWSRRAGQRRLIRRPMFPGYLFLRHAMDRDAYIEVRKVRGLVTVLGRSWDRLAVVPDGEIEAVRALSSSDLPSMPYPYLRQGMRVRIATGRWPVWKGSWSARTRRRGSWCSPSSCSPGAWRWRSTAPPQFLTETRSREATG